MNSKSGIIIAVVIVLLIGGGIFLFSRNKHSSPQKNNYEANKTSVSNNSNQTNNNKEIKQGITESEEKNNTSFTTEEQIATYTTKIYSNDSARQNNISITCKALNGNIVKNGSTFSFCGTIGLSSTSKGYQKADIFDKDGNKKKGLGGR